MYPEFALAARRLQRTPSFALSVCATVVLSVSACVVVFSLAHGLVLRPLPYADPDQVVVIWERDLKRGVPVVEVSHRNFLDWRAMNRGFAELAVFGSVNWSLRLAGEDTVDLPYAAVSGSFFSLLRSAPELGRTLTPLDDRPGAQPVVVLSFGLWKTRFGGSPQIVGQTVELSRKHYTVVGVMPRGFDFPAGAQLWAPLVPALEAVSRQNGFDALEARWLGVLYGLGRLKEGISSDFARDDLGRLVTRLDPNAADRSLVFTPLLDRVHGRTRPALLLLLGAVLLTFLIACANVSALFLMRAAERARETAIRLAIGASPSHLWQAWMAESLLLFAAGGGAGVVVGSLILPAVTALAPQGLYRVDEVTVGWPSVGFALAASLLGALLTTLATTTATGRLRVHEDLRSSGVGGTARRGQRSRRVLVSAEVALASAVLVVAGLTIRSFVNLTRLDLGFEPTRVLTFSVSPPESTLARETRNTDFYGALLDRVRRLPGVTTAGAVFLRPLLHEAIGVDAQVLREGQAPGDLTAWRNNPVVNKQSATPGYFEAMRITVRQGRSFDASDRRSGPLVAILSQAAARALWPGESPIGKRLIVAGDSNDAQGRWLWRTVVGVVADVRYRGLQDVRHDLYLPHEQTADPVKHFALRFDGDAFPLISGVRTAIREFDKTAVVDGFATMETIVHQATAPWRVNLVVFVVLGGLALSLAVVGLYGLVAYAVAERWREFGIRSALGASGAQLAKLAVGEGATLVLIGLPIGLISAMTARRFTEALLFGVPGTDGATLLGVAGTLLVVSLAASYLPARKAARIDPAALLRGGDL